MSILPFGSALDRARGEVARIEDQLREALAGLDRDRSEHAGLIDAEIGGDQQAGKRVKAVSDLLLQRQRRIADLEGAQRRAQERLDRAEAAERAKAEGERRRQIGAAWDVLIAKAEEFERQASETGQSATRLMDAARDLQAMVGDVTYSDALAEHALRGRLDLSLARAGMVWLAGGLDAWALEHRVSGVSDWLRGQRVVAQRGNRPAADDDATPAA